MERKREAEQVKKTTGVWRCACSVRNERGACTTMDDRAARLNHVCVCLSEEEKGGAPTQTSLSNSLSSSVITVLSLSPLVFLLVFQMLAQKPLSDLKGTESLSSAGEIPLSLHYVYIAFIFSFCTSSTACLLLLCSHQKHSSHPVVMYFHLLSRLFLLLSPHLKPPPHHEFSISPPISLLCHTVLSSATKEEQPVYNYSTPDCHRILLSHPSLPSYPITSPPAPLKHTSNQ